MPYSSASPDDFPDDFDAEYGDAFDALPDMDFGADTAGAAAFAQRKERLVEALVSGETGVQFEALALFAEPLFSLYDLDPAEAFRLRDGAAAADEEAVALMETARVLWAFFSLPPPERATRRGALAAQLVGEAPTDDDWLSLDSLLDAAEIHWRAMLPEEVAAAQATGQPTLGFDALVQHPIFHIGDDAAAPAADAMSDVEARARFAQTLLDDAADDPDAFEDTLARADAWWAVATSADPEAELRAFARQQHDPAAALAEGRRMIARYRDLFGSR